LEGKDAHFGLANLSAKLAQARALTTCSHDFPFEALTYPTKQFPVVEPENWFARLYVDSQKATLHLRLHHDFNFAHDFPLSDLPVRK
jgi:hypothetical protein